MLKLVILCLIIIFLLLFWIWAIKPNHITEERKALVKPFQDTYIAHRGLFSNKKKKGQAPLAPENSLQAFRLAVEHGYGMEMDVQMTKDGKLVVFHDGNLKRMCGVDGDVLDYTYEELQAFPLKGSEQRIPLFTEVRDLVAGRSPMLIEVKPEGDCCKTASLLNEQLKDYKGIYCMESFDPRAVHWYRKNRPDVLRGQLSECFPKKAHLHENIAQLICKNLLLNFWGRPDFIAYNHKHKNQTSYRLLRKLYPVFNAAWTIKNQEELEEARDVFSVMIFDSFIPDEGYDE